MKQLFGRKFVLQWVGMTTLVAAGTPTVVPALWPLWLGIGQWMVLRNYVSRAWLWLILTVIGGYTAMAYVLFAMSIVVPITEGSPSFIKDVIALILSVSTFPIPGIIRSGFQCLLFKRHTARYRQWIWQGALATVSALSVVLCLMYFKAWSAQESLGTVYISPIENLCIFGLAGFVGSSVEGKFLSLLKTSDVGLSSADNA